MEEIECDVCKIKGNHNLEFWSEEHKLLLCNECFFEEKYVDWLKQKEVIKWKKTLQNFRKGYV